jgi:hypothetical protein
MRQHVLMKLRVSECWLGAVGKDEGGGNTIDGDAMGGPFESQAPREVIDRGL